MPFNLGFSDDGSRHTSQAGGLFGVLSALTAESRPPGVGGVLRAIADPGAVMAQQYAAEDRQRLGQVLDTIQPLQANALRLIELGDDLNAERTMQQIAGEYARNGINPEKAMTPLLLLAERAKTNRMQQLDPTKGDYLQRLTGYSRTPSEAADVFRAIGQDRLTGEQAGEAQARRLGVEQKTQHEGLLFPIERQGAQLSNTLRQGQIGLVGAQTQGEYADTARTRQATEHEGLLFPIVREGAGLGNELKRGEITLNQAQLATEDERTGLVGAQAGKERLLTDIMRKNKGLDPYQAAQLSAGQRDDEQALLNDIADFTAKGLKGGDGLLGNSPAPTVEQAQAAVDAYNERLTRMGLDKRLVLDKQAAQPERTDPNTGRPIKGTAQEASYQPRLVSLNEFNQMQRASAIDQASDDEIAGLSIDPNRLSERQRARAQEMQAELEQAIAGAPEGRAKQLYIEMRRRMLKEFQQQGE